MAYTYFIIVPALVKDSPIKGAVALANELSQSRRVSIVFLKKGIKTFHFFDSRVQVVSLWKKGGWLQRLKAYQQLLHQAGGRSSVVSISLCLSADMINSWCRDFAVTCASVRGNLPIVYAQSFGRLGQFIAYCHLRRMRKMDFVLSMTKSMAFMVERYIKKESPIIGNFLDEKILEKYRRLSENTGPLRFVFTGSLISGKQPGLLISAMAEILDAGENAVLDIYGDGPLMDELLEQASSLKNSKAVRFHGYIDSPYYGIAGADVLVLPSLTEGISRSALEALYLGVPCVLRNTDGNAEMIKDGWNGALFYKDGQLPRIMMAVGSFARKKALYKEILLPDTFRQSVSVQRLVNLLEGQEKGQ